MPSLVGNQDFSNGYLHAAVIDGQWTHLFYGRIHSRDPDTQGVVRLAYIPEELSFEDLRQGHYDFLHVATEDGSRLAAAVQYYQDVCDFKQREPDAHTRPLHKAVLFDNHPCGIYRIPGHDYFLAYIEDVEGAEPFKIHMLEHIGPTEAVKGPCGKEQIVTLNVRDIYHLCRLGPLPSQFLHHLTPENRQRVSYTIYDVELNRLRASLGEAEHRKREALPV